MRCEVFGFWNVFIFFVIGLVVGLGNIWRFFYVVYEGGGGVFFILYLCVLFMVGIFLLFFDYVIGYWFCGLVLLVFCCLYCVVELLGWW